MKKLILRGLTSLLHPIYIGKPHHGCLILELLIDILCVYPEKEIRAEAYVCLEKVFSFLDIHKAQKILIIALKKLTEEGKNEKNIRDLTVRMIPYIYKGANEESQAELLEILKIFT